jgi:hypothetical protein
MKKIFFISVMAVVTFAACTKKASPAKVKPTTFTADILPITQAKCTPCHGTGSNKGDFLNYESAKKFAPEMLDRVMIAPGGRGFMPKNHDKLADTEIALIKKWIDGGLLEK